MDDDILLEEIKHERVNAYIEDVSKKLSDNNDWNTFRPDEIAEASLQVADLSLIDDEQTGRFRQFLSIATNFSSLAFAEKLLIIPVLVESIKQLLEDMMREIQEYADMANELRDIIHCFVRMVMEVKHKVKMTLPLLTAAKSQIGIIQDVMNTDPSQALNEIDRRDIQLALNRMSIGIQNLLSLARSSREESQRINERVHTITNAVQSKKIIIEERLEIARFCFKCAMPTCSITAGVAMGGCVAAESFGGVGALVVAGTAFPPVTAIVGATILGGISAGTAIILVKKFWARHQLKALGYLNEIFERLVQLNSANMYFMCYMMNAEEKVNAVSQHMEDVQLCLESERQRRINQNVCSVAVDSTRAMMQSLEQISNLDISKWTNSSNAIGFSDIDII